jgi:hypothetical protein
MNQFHKVMVLMTLLHKEELNPVYLERRTEKSSRNPGLIEIERKLSSLTSTMTHYTKHQLRRRLRFTQNFLTPERRYFVKMQIFVQPRPPRRRGMNKPLTRTFSVYLHKNF